MKANWQLVLKILKNEKTALWFWISFAALFIGAFVILTTEVQEAAQGHPELIGVIDELPAQHLEKIRGPGLNAVAVDFTGLGSSVVVSVFVVMSAVLLLLKRQYADMIHLIASGMGAAFLTWALKSFFERPRPMGLSHLVEVQGYSYPSGHSLGSATVYFTFAILLCNVFQKWRDRLVVIGLALIFIFLVGLSRVYLGVHYISDVLAGLMVGIGWAALLGAIRSYLEVQGVGRAS